MTPYISIIIPCYNVDRYIQKCLDSIVSQSYSDFEILCINDGSTDNTLALLRKFSMNDPRIIVYDQMNKGISETRTLGLKYALGEFIMFVDGDDWLDPDCLQIVLENQDREDIVFFSYTREFAYQSIPKQLGLQGKYSAADIQRRMVGPIGKETANIENLDALVTVWGKLYKSDKIKNMKFTEVSTIGTWEDGLFNLNVLEHCDVILILDQPLYHYRKTNQNSFTSRYKKDFFTKWLVKFSLISELIADKDAVYKEALQNRIGLSILGLTLTEINNQNSVGQKLKGIKTVLSEKTYHNALKTLDKSAMPVHWKIFYTFAEHRMVLPVFIIANAILLLINRKN